MKPYFEQDGIRLYHGDCREVFPSLGAGWADCILADPPYGETELGWDRRVAGWIGAARPSLKRPGSLWCFGSLRHFWAERDAFDGWKLAQEIVWEKHNGSSFHVDRFRRVHELIAHFYPTAVPWGDVYKCPIFTMDATKRTVATKLRPTSAGERKNNPGTVYVSRDGGPKMMRSVLRVRSCHGRARHPTEKPVGILSPLVEFSCPPGGTIAVPFAGVGSELEAARLAGRMAVGVELSEAYCEKAARRLSQRVLNLIAGD